MPVADADADRDAGPDIEADADPSPDTNPDTEADRDPHLDADPDPDAHPNPGSDPDPRVDQPRGRRLAGKPRSQRDHRDVDAVPLRAVERLRAG